MRRSPTVDVVMKCLHIDTSCAHGSLGVDYGAAESYRVLSPQSSQGGSRFACIRWVPSVTTPCPGKGVTPSAGTPDFTLSNWHDFAVSFDGAKATLYLDGVEKHFAQAPAVGSSAAFFSLLGRVFDPTGNSLDGLLDEVRIATTIRSAAWIAVQHATQGDPGSFYSLGPEEPRP